MKTKLFAVILLFVSVNIFAQSDYEKAVITTLESLGKAQSLDEMQNVANKFERIATAEKEEWLPRYYASFINVLLSFRTEDVAQKKKYLDYAQQQLDEAMKIESEESELHTLQGMLYQSFIMFDPMGSGQAYLTKATAAFNDAKKLNPNNPRPYYLDALTILNTPEQFGGGKKAAYPLLLEASELFAKFEATSAVMPDWGKEDCEAQLQSCKEGM